MTTGMWRAVPALAAPVVVAATGAPRQVAGHPVLASAFVSVTTGWTVVTTPPMVWLLGTEDAGATWTCKLAWRGSLYGRLRAFDAHRVALTLGLWPTYGNEVNGRPVASGEQFQAFVVATEDGGATWTLGSPPDRQGFHVYFGTTRQIWMLIGVPGSYPRTDLARTGDGGATWSRSDGTGDLPLIQVAFSSLDDGLLIAADRRRADILYQTTDGGDTWTRQRLIPPPRLRASVETWLFPVLHPEAGNLLTLRAVSRVESITRPDWEGTYAYARAGDGWAGPYRLPMRPAGMGNDLLVPDPEGRFWGASGHDVWVSDDLAGPWHHQRVPLPDEETIADIVPVDDGVLWLTTSGRDGGQLYRSDDGGTRWSRLSVAST